MLWRCKHEFDPKNGVKDGFQFCIKCGKAVEVERQPELPCNHQWETVRAVERNFAGKRVEIITELRSGGR